MFVRKYAVRDVVYLALVETIWNPVQKKYNQNRIASLGKLSELEYRNHRIEKMVTALDLFCKRSGIATIGDGLILNNLSVNEETVSATYDFGIYRVASFVLKTLGITGTVAGLSFQAKISKEKLVAAAEGLIAHHLMPQTDVSERATHAWY